MPRRHALQARPGASRALHVRVTDAERAGLERVARRTGPTTTVSEIVRRAIETQLSLASGRSAFFKVFARLVEDLADVDVHPILVGTWAAAAHGYLSPAKSFDLVVREKDLPRLLPFLAARGVDIALLFPFSIGRSPWCVRLATTFDDRAPETLPTQGFSWGVASLEVVTLDGLLAHGASSLPDYVMDALQELKAGTHHLDDGERGVVAWDAVGRLTSSAFYPDRATRAPHKFLDFRLVS